MNKRKLTDEQIKIICTSYPTGRTTDEIADELGLTKRIVLRVLNENNITLRKPGGRFKGGVKASWDRNKHKYEATRKKKQEDAAKDRERKKSLFDDGYKAVITKQYLEDKMGMAAIGEPFGFSKSKVKKLLVSWGVPIDPPGQKYHGGKKVSDKKYFEANKDKIRERTNIWHHDNKERLQIYHKQWREDNIDKIREKATRKHKQKINSDPLYKLHHNTRYAVWASLKDKNLVKIKRTFELLQYTPEELKLHLESQFDSEMTWENYGQWHVDHIIPSSKFVYMSEDDIGFQQCWALSNLRPLWGYDNCSKNNRLNDITFDSINFLTNNNENLIKAPLNYDTVILTKEYLEAYKKDFGVDKMKEFVPDLVKLFRIYHPEFPYPTLTEYVSSIRNKIKNYDYSKIYWDEKSFKNASSSMGNNYLKHLFKEYWNCNYKNTLSPVKCWESDKELSRIIAWRIGVNNSNETYDLSPKIIIRGISAARQTISFFKPLIAAAIYKHYNSNDKQDLTVFDPCAGFGGRMLGFKSLYPNGKYVALEPNKHTFGGLITLGGELGGCELYKTTLEDFNKDIKYDFGFTSIPYFDLERYEGEDTNYADFSDWEETFIKKLLTYPRMLINMSTDLCDRLGLNEYIDTYLVSPPSHFAKTREPKREVILKINWERLQR